MSQAAATLSTPQAGRPDPDLFVRHLPDGENEMILLVDGMHCGGCIARIERTLTALPGLTAARANLSTKRVRVSWKPERLKAGDIVASLAGIGFEAVPFEPQIASQDALEQARLLRALGVAGFAAANVMLISVSVWSGLVTDMETETRIFFHWLSALIALPAIAYAGQPFFRSAWRALSHRQVNMDVPISLGVCLAAGMSLVETILGAEHVYFDAAISLLFFLLIGRYLDLQARARANTAAQNLLSLRALTAIEIAPDGTQRSVAIRDVRPGMRLLVPAGTRIPADGTVEEGSGTIDASLVTGESLPHQAQAGSDVFAGTMNLDAPLIIRATRSDDRSLLSEIVALMEAAEQSRSGYVRLADRMARHYAPAVHLLAAATLILWLALGGGWHIAITNAIAVLIITCPCALGLAVPVVQTVAAGRLLRNGVIVKSGDALERLADADHIVFDKTGTLTVGRPVLVNADAIAPADLARAAALAASSRHPLALALKPYASAAFATPANVREIPGAGLEGEIGGEPVRLGNREFVAGDSERAVTAHTGPELWVRTGSAEPVQFRFADQVKTDAAASVCALKSMHLDLEIASGDRKPAVEAVSSLLGIDSWAGELKPGGKIDRLTALKAAGHHVLMVGDGLNDAPALRAASVSMSPASAADISQTAADFVIQGNRLAPVPETIRIARRARRLVVQNFAIALGYNAIAVPLAVAGYVTPLIAAIAMSASSITVTLNALRLNLGSASQRRDGPA